MKKQKSKTALPYLHGFTTEEQQRLLKQAEFLEHIVYLNIDLTDVKDLLEVGCGVGAQSSILLRRFPKLNLTGIDFSADQLGAAKSQLASLAYAEDRYKLKRMDAQNMDFKAKMFDGAFLCWILEHVPEPTRILNEVRRVLRPGGIVYVTEVVNSSFFLDPYSPNVWKYWMALNDYQYDGAGDPFVGAKLGNMLTAVGFQMVETNVVTMHLDNRHPEKRRQMIAYWTNLMVSAADQLIKAGYVDKATVDGMKKEMRSAEKDPNAVFMYSFMQAKATALAQ